MEQYTFLDTSAMPQLWLIVPGLDGMLIKPECQRNTIDEKTIQGSGDHTDVMSSKLSLFQHQVI
jgi:hypothetical protein